jgi:hypothetical protein
MNRENPLRADLAEQMRQFEKENGKVETIPASEYVESKEATESKKANKKKARSIKEQVARERVFKEANREAEYAKAGN